MLIERYDMISWRPSAAGYDQRAACPLLMLLVLILLIMAATSVQERFSFDHLGLETVRCRQEALGISTPSLFGALSVGFCDVLFGWICLRCI